MGNELGAGNPCAAKRASYTAMIITGMLLVLYSYIYRFAPTS